MSKRNSLLITPLDGYARDIGVWLSALQDARARTLRVLQDIDPQWLDFLPGDDGENISTILYHLAAIEASWLFEEVLQSDLPPEMETLFPYDVRDANGKLMPVSESMQQHKERLKHIRERLLVEFSNMTADNFAKARSLPDYDVSPVYVIHHLMQHEAEHRSQINWIGMKAKIALGSGLPKE